jgi:hypothetical protein
VVPPRFGTPRTPERLTLGPAVGQAARLLGKELMPWQQHVADVALELDPATGRLVYREVGLVVPRQSGKSTLVLALMLQRALATRQFGQRQRIVYTAQTRKDARKKWEEDYVADLEAAPKIRPRIKVDRTPGRERVIFPNGSMFGIEASTEKAGHGGTLDLAFIDEAFAQVDARLQQAFEPAMITRPQSQMWVVSTAGWEGESPFLEEKQDAGRQRVLDRQRADACYFEWSAPDDADPGDPATWRACMPALDLVRADGSGITTAAIRARWESARRTNPNNFRRPYLNQRVPKQSAPDSVIPQEAWRAAAVKDPRSRGAQIVGSVVLAVDVNPSRTHGSIAVAGARADGRTHVELVAYRPGTDWIVSTLLRFVQVHDPAALVIDRAGPGASLVPDLEKAGLEPTMVGAAEMKQACGAFYDDAIQGRLTHPDEPLINNAVIAAKKRELLDAWAWGRKNDVDISPLVAVTLARHGFATAEGPRAPGPPPLPVPAAAGLAGVGAGSVAGLERIDLAGMNF